MIGMNHNCDLFQTTKVLHKLNFKTDFSFLFTEKDDKNKKSIFILSKSGGIAIIKGNNYNLCVKKYIGFNVSSATQIENNIFGIISSEGRVFFVDAYDEEINAQEFTDVPNALYILPKYNEEEFLIISNKCAAFSCKIDHSIRVIWKEFSEEPPNDAKIVCDGTKLVVYFGKKIFFSDIVSDAEPLSIELPFTVNNIYQFNKDSFMCVPEEEKLIQQFSFDSGKITYNKVESVYSTEENKIVDILAVKDDEVALISKHNVFIYNNTEKNRAKVTISSKFDMQIIKSIAESDIFAIGTKEGYVLIAMRRDNKLKVYDLFNFNESEIENIHIINKDCFIAVSKNGKVVLFENAKPWFEMAPALYA